MSPSKTAGAISKSAIAILIAVILLAGLALDLVSIRGVSDWALYILVILLAMRKARRRALLLIAGASSVFTVVGLLLSPPNSLFWMSSVNRTLGLVLIWTTVYVSLRWRQAEDALQRSEENHRNLVEQASDAIFVADANFRLLDFNASACALSGYSREEILGKSLLDFMLKEDLVTSPIRMEELRTGKPLVTERRFRRKDGVIVPIEINNRILPDGRFQGIVRDITERKRAEAALRESEVKYRALIETTATGYVILDTEGRVLDANPEYVRLAGRRTLDEVLGHNVTEWTASHDVARNEDEVQKCAKQGFVRNLEIDHVNRAGEFIPIEVNATVVPAAEGARIVTLCRDITERKRAGEALRASEDRYRDLVEHSQDLICTHDLEGRILSVNEAPALALGWEQHELVGRNLRDIISPEVRSEFGTYLATIRRDGAAEGLMVVLTKSGKRRVWEYHNTLRTEGVAVPIVRGLAHDVTERLRAEAALRRSEQRYKDFMSHSNEGVWRIELDQPIEVGLPAEEAIDRLLRHGYFAECNDASARILGFARADEVVGKRVADLIPPADQDRIESLRALAREGWQSKTVQQDTINISGNCVPVLRTTIPIVENGRVARIWGTSQDISELKQREEALVKLRQAVNASGEVVFMTDREGIITFINPEFTRLYGYTEAEVVGKATPRILKSGATQAGYYTQFWESILAKQVARGEITNRANDGRLVTVASSANAILDGRGNIAGFLAIQRDVTAHKELEDRLRQAQKMEAMGRMAGGVAHDFNNLLTVIKGYAQLMQDRLKPRSPLHSQLAQIRKAVERAAGLTQQLLAFSRHEVLNPHVLDLNNVVRNTHKMLQRLIGADVEFRTLLQPELWRVRADPVQIDQILINLTLNARDAMPGGGQLTIETVNLNLDEEYARWQPAVVPGEYVALCVSDTGIGMDSQTQERMFEPFFTTKEQGKGTGLGLATVYGIVKQSGGNIRVYSEPGTGTTFKICLPRAEGEVEATLPWGEGVPARRAG